MKKRTPQRKARATVAESQASLLVIAAGSAISFPWSVPAEVLGHLSDARLKELLTELLLAEAYLQSADVSQVTITAESDAADEGCDAWSPRTPNPSPWLGDRQTCWQFKAGKAGEPARLKGEVAKPIPRKTLAGGGRYVVVASGSVSGKSGRLRRLDVLVSEAKKLGLSTERIDVFTSESLATWLNEYPAVSGKLRGLPGGYWTLTKWDQDELHSSDWFPSQSLKDALVSVQRALAPIADAVHVHVRGRPGVGKTRFGLEVCRTAPWRNSVLYIPQPSETNVLELLESLAHSPARVVLVVDEAPPEMLNTWGSATHRANGRIGLLTIGHSGSPDGSSTELEIRPLDHQEMLAAIQAWHPEMSREQHDFIATFSDGYIRLAWLAGRALERNPGMNAHDLLKTHDIRALMDALLGSSDKRRALHVVAALSSVGWDGQRASEGAAISKHLGLDWNDVRAAVHEFDKHLGIAPRAGDLRYISPIPLGVYLAIDAWESYRDLMESLPSILPTEGAKRAYYERLEAVVSSPSAKQFAQDELRLFFSWDHFTNEADVNRWAVLSGADPVGASQRIRQALQKASRSERQMIAGKARRRLVEALADLASGATTFKDATVALAELADAENESWGNNASGEFRRRFQIYLGGTACPYSDRLSVIDELLSRSDDSYWKLAAEALSKVGDTHAFGTAPLSKLDSPREHEWEPSTAPQLLAAIVWAVERLIKIAQAARPGVAESLAKAAEDLRLLLRLPEVREPVAKFFRAILLNYPTLRGRIRQVLHLLIDNERKLWKDLSKEDVAWLESLYSEFEDRSPEGRLRDLVGLRDYQFDVDRLEPLAKELKSSPDLLESQWSWLTSGEAVHGWELGAALARIDGENELLPRLLDPRGRGSDIRFIAGYLSEAAKARETSWTDDLLDRYEKENPQQIAFVAELTWASAPTDRGAVRLARFATSGVLRRRTAEQLVLGGWPLRLSKSSFQTLLQALVERNEYHEAAVTIAHQRLSEKPEEWDTLTTLVLKILANHRLLRGSSMAEFSWMELARKLVPSHARYLASLLFAAHASQDDGSIWFLRHSQAAGILSMCVDTDAAGVWEELKPYLEKASTAFRFSVGLPEGMLDRLPHQSILDWIAQAPEERALRIARLVAKSLMPGSLGEKLLAAYSKIENLANEYFSAWVSGGFAGKASAHWEGIGAALRSLTKTTREPAVAEWAAHAAEEFIRMAEAERKREEEERVRWPHWQAS